MGRIRILPVGFFLSALAFLFSLQACKQAEKAGEVWIPEILTFAGDTVPISDPDIKERLERELLINRYWHASTAQWIMRSGRWFPLFDSLLQKNGVPADFKYLVAIESGFDNVVSNKGATGFWQLMEPTAREFGLQIDSEIDERLDPERSTLAACKLLLRGRREFGKWPETAVSYNIGVNGLRSVMEAQYTDSFYDLLINQESGRYFFRILAAKLILENPERYGFENLKPAKAYSWKEIEISDSIPDLAWWCRKNGFTYKCFRLLNPWIRTSAIHLPNGRNTLKVKMPLDCKQFTDMDIPPIPALDSAALKNRHTEENLVGKKDMAGFGAAVSGKSTGTAEQLKFHEIARGESLSLISIRYGINLSALFRLNPELKGRADKVHEGMKIRIKED